MKILVIIISYNFERWMDRCLSSLLESEHPVDVLVIDNCSQDNTVQRIKQNYKKIRLIECHENLGFGGASNIGIQIAIREEYEAVFMLNQDAWIDRRTIGKLSALCEKHSEYGILSPVHLTGDGNSFDHGFATYAKVSDMDKISDKEIVEVPFVNAAFWMVPTRILRIIGGFSPLFYHYGEDKDYTNRIKYHGYKTGYSPHVFGFHDRQDRKVNRSSFFRSEKVYLLSEYANINYSFIQAFKYGILAGVKKALQSLAHGKWKDAFTVTGITLRLLVSTRKIIDIRQKTRLKQDNFIHS